MVRPGSRRVPARNSGVGRKARVAEMLCHAGTRKPVVRFRNIDDCREVQDVNCATVSLSVVDAVVGTRAIKVDYKQEG